MRREKTTRILKVERDFEPSRMAGQAMAKTYETVVPITKRSLPRFEREQGPSAMFRSRLDYQVSNGGQK